MQGGCPQFAAGPKALRRNGKKKKPQVYARGGSQISTVHREGIMGILPRATREKREGLLETRGGSPKKGGLRLYKKRSLGSFSP